MNCNWTGKIQITPLFVYISWKREREWLYNFKASSEEVIVMLSETMNAKYIKSMCKRIFFFCKLAGWHLADSLRIDFFTDNFQGFGLNDNIPMATSRNCAKCLKNTCEINIVYACWNPAN